MTRGHPPRQSRRVLPTRIRKCGEMISSRAYFRADRRPGSAADCRRNVRPQRSSTARCSPAPRADVPTSRVRTFGIAVHAERGFFVRIGGIVPRAGRQLDHAAPDIVGDADAGEARAALVEQADDVAIGDAARRGISADACARPRVRDAWRPRCGRRNRAGCAAASRGWLATRISGADGAGTAPARARSDGRDSRPRRKLAMVSEKISSLPLGVGSVAPSGSSRKRAQLPAVVRLLRHDQAVARPELVETRRRQIHAPPAPSASAHTDAPATGGRCGLR